MNLRHQGLVRSIDEPAQFGEAVHYVVQQMFLEYKTPLFIHFQVDDACDVDSKMCLGVVSDQSGVKIDCDKQCYVDEAIYK